jgi:hypothetical protein
MGKVLQRYLHALADYSVNVKKYQQGGDKLGTALKRRSRDGGATTGGGGGVGFRSHLQPGAMHSAIGSSDHRNPISRLPR